MAVATGVRQLWAADYTYNSGITYSNLVHVGRLVSVNPSINVSDGSTFYADDAPAEDSSGIFTGGTIDVVVDGLESDVRKKMFGAHERTVSTIAAIAHSADDVSPYKGIGYIEREQMNGVVSYVPVVYPKIAFSPSIREVATQGETVEFQTLSLSGTILREDSSNHDWVWIATSTYTTEETALEALKKMLGYTAPSNS